MKQYIFIISLLIHTISFGQKSAIKTDFNTIYICIDSTTYKQLFQSKYLKDTLFLCREQQEETNVGSYTGKYLIGESATIEFFQPKVTHQLGDNFADWGIEFKTRKINLLDQLIKKSNLQKITIDTFTTNLTVDSLQISWYKSMTLKHSNNELAILEYQSDYLKYLGFTNNQINQPMTYKTFNELLSNGMKYPRGFSMVTYIKLFADKKLIDRINKYAKLNNCKKVKNAFTNGETTIEYIEVQHLPKFLIKEIGISLINNQPYHYEKISENLFLRTLGKKASLIFNYTD
ncbi:DUF5829 family protein [Ferruginibacter yonginensis]|uniref:DUF5829 family protein n=1 Tax=Ferruginibacter yonginensis TaxID=1310416 RepID=A0ABV8QR16_9BACT